MGRVTAEHDPGDPVPLSASPAISEAAERARERLHAEIERVRVGVEEMMAEQDGGADPGLRRELDSFRGETRDYVKRRVRKTEKRLEKSIEKGGPAGPQARGAPGRGRAGQALRRMAHPHQHRGDARRPPPRGAGDRRPRHPHIQIALSRSRLGPLSGSNLDLSAPSRQSARRSRPGRASGAPPRELLSHRRPNLSLTCRRGIPGGAPDAPTQSRSTGPPAPCAARPSGSCWRHRRRGP